VMRIKALHDYVADRIAYDAPAYATGHIPHEDGDAQAVFRSHKGVCAGYAALMRELGKATGDEIAYVVGDARSSRHPMEGESHAEFFRRPVVAPEFFRWGLELRQPDRSQVTATGPLVVEVANPRGAFLLADFEPKSGGARTDCKGDGKTTFRCTFPAAGTYDV